MFRQCLLPGNTNKCLCSRRGLPEKPARAGTAWTEGFQGPLVWQEEVGEESDKAGRWKEAGCPDARPLQNDQVLAFLL